MSSRTVKKWNENDKGLYLIYGLGSVIDYAKDNEKVKEIPDKAVEKIIDWMDLNKEEYKK